MTGHEPARALARILGGETADSLESRTLDFKRQGRSREDALRMLAAAAACFANDIGGDVGGRGARQGRRCGGHRRQRSRSVRVVQRIYELTEPSLIVSSHEIECAGRRLLVVSVPRSPDIHQVDQRTTHRVGTSCVPMTAAQIASALADRRSVDWSAGDAELDRSDVSPVALDIARSLLRQSPDPARRRYAAETDGDLLRILGLLGPQGRLNRAGALLLARSGFPGRCPGPHARSTSSARPQRASRPSYSGSPDHCCAHWYGYSRSSTLGWTRRRSTCPAVSRCSWPTCRRQRSGKQWSTRSSTVTTASAARYESSTPPLDCSWRHPDRWSSE